MSRLPTKNVNYTAFFALLPYSFYAAAKLPVTLPIWKQSSGRFLKS